MAGLLDDWNLNTPEAQGLLAAAFGGLAGARRGAPMNSIGRAGLAGLSGYANAQDRQFQQQDEATRRKMTELQLEQMQRANTNEKGLLGLQSQFFTPGSAGTPGTAGLNMPDELSAGFTMPTTAPTAPKFDVQGYTGTALSKGLMTPLAAAQLQAQMGKESSINKVDVKDFTPASVAKFAQSRNYGDLVRMDKLHFADTGGAISGLDPFTGKPVGQAPKSGDPFKDLVLGDGTGGLRPNTPLIGAKQSIAKSGASNTNIKVENKMGEGLAAQVGPMMKDSTSIAEGAVKQVDAAQRIVKAIDSDKIFTGPGAGIRMKTSQVGQMLGIGGKDDAEKIANTRAAIRGMSELTLQGRQQMKGQGAITESEGALAEKAMSGNIEDLTAAEVKQLAKASERAARFNYAEHQRKLKVMESNPALQGVAPFYSGPAMAAEAVEGAAPIGAPTQAPAYRYVNGKLEKVQ